MKNNGEYSDLKLLNLPQSKKIYSIEEIKENLKETFKKYNLTKVYIFGSYARGEATENSDIDLIIVGGNIKGMFAFSKFALELVSVLKKEFDIINEKTYTDNIENDSELIKKSKKMFYENICKERILIYG